MSERCRSGTLPRPMTRPHAVIAKALCREPAVSRTRRAANNDRIASPVAAKCRSYIAGVGCHAERCRSGTLPRPMTRPHAVIAKALCREPAASRTRRAANNDRIASPVAAKCRSYIAGVGCHAERCRSGTLPRPMTRPRAVIAKALCREPAALRTRRIANPPHREPAAPRTPTASRLRSRQSAAPTSLRGRSSMQCSGGARCYCPRNTGLRRSRKALVPSFMSAVAAQMAKACDS